MCFRKTHAFIYNTRVDLGMGGGGTGGMCPPAFCQKKNCAQGKMQKHNIIEIYQIELRLKEISYLIIIVETKKTFSAFQFFHQHYRYNGSGKLIAAVRASNLKRSKLWKFVNTSVCTLRKNKISVKNASNESCFYKAANPEL